MEGAGSAVAHDDDDASAGFCPIPLPSRNEDDSETPL